jgi:hypothetical protein
MTQAMQAKSEKKNSETDARNGTLQEVAARFEAIEDIAKLTMTQRSKLLQSLSDQWAATKSERLTQINQLVNDVLRCVRWINSADFGNDELQASLGQRMILWCLERADSLPVETEYALVVRHICVSMCQKRSFARNCSK